MAFIYQSQNFSFKLFKRWNATVQEIPRIEFALSEEDLILECLGAAVIMRWESLPVEEQREMLKQAYPLAGLAKNGQLKDHVARFLHGRHGSLSG